MIPKDPLRKTNSLHLKTGRNPMESMVSQPSIWRRGELLVSGRISVSKLWESFLPKSISWNWCVRIGPTSQTCWYSLTHTHKKAWWNSQNKAQINSQPTKTRGQLPWASTRKNRTCTKGPFESISSQCGLFSKQLERSVFVDDRESHGSLDVAFSTWVGVPTKPWTLLLYIFVYFC